MTSSSVELRVCNSASDDYSRGFEAGKKSICAASTHAYLDDLLATGLYGMDRQEVIEGLLLRGVREAIDAKIIGLRNFK